MRPVRASVRALAAIALAAASAVAPAASIVGTKHNLSVSGPGPIRALSETRICVFCHAPHNATPGTPLWNRPFPGHTYIPYSSSTTRASPGQPTGASLMCLGCHDGTIALGDVLNGTSTIAMSGVTTMPPGDSRLGTDLSDDHPVSFPYTSGLASTRGELADPATLVGPVRLDASGQMQCTACHDPHDDSFGKFLVMANQASALCQTCHLLDHWTTSSHRLSSATWNGVPPDPWPRTTLTTVAANACESCHRPHTAPGADWLLNSSIEEDNCYPCHNGNVASLDIEHELVAKPYVHPVAASTGTHDAAEPTSVQARHVECVDCHDPHATRAGGANPPGALLGARGITIAGTETAAVTAEHEVCFRCHADSPGKPAPPTIRQLVQTNTRLEFATANPSFHPVAGPGVNPNVPTLIAPWTTSSTMGCGDCHNNNAGPGAGGTGPAGPHGSTYPSLLERRYATADRTSESASNYALCYKCHSRTILLRDASGFPHDQHVRDLRSPCNVCHDPHGVSATQGNPINNSKLINFDLAVVSPSAGRLRFESRGTNRGRCYLVCHGKNHDPYDY
ncbi:MAG: cytochrome C [Chromatiales bacterium]|nr:cytochrome C [Chromatiales bacterium]